LGRARRFQKQQIIAKVEYDHLRNTHKGTVKRVPWWHAGHIRVS
jgi:hypothetical protein